MRQIITVENIANYRDITTNVPSKRIVPFINEAQDIDLRNVLGKALYEKVIDDISPLYYPELDSYIIPCLCYWAYARIVRNNRATVTSNGVVQKNVDGSVQGNDQSVTFLITDAKEAAAAYANRLIDFLNDNSVDYPEWGASCHRPNVKGSIKISSVGDKQDYNDAVKDEVNRQSLYGNNGNRIR